MYLKYDRKSNLIINEIDFQIKNKNKNVRNYWTLKNDTNYENQIISFDVILLD